MFARNQNLIGEAEVKIRRMDTNCPTVANIRSAWEYLLDNNDGSTGSQDALLDLERAHKALTGKTPQECR